MNKTAKKNPVSAGKMLLWILATAAEILLLVFILIGRADHAKPEQTADAVPEPTFSAFPSAPEPAPISVDYSRETAAMKITEVMAKNTASLMAEDGSFPDWFEICNFSDDPIDITGWSVTDGGKRWVFPDVKIDGGERLIVYAGAETGLSANFSLSEGETLSLLDPNGDVADQLTLPEAAANLSYAVTDNGSFEQTAYFTPGFDNTSEGYKAYQETLNLPQSPLVISEVCTANLSSEQNINDEHPDWVELYNRSETAVRLADYWLSDKNSDRRLFQLPDRELRAGEYILIYCSKDFTGEETSPSVIRASFSLGSDFEHLWLTAADGATADFVSLRDMPANGSYGREDGQNGWFFFEKATPGQKNTGGCRSMAEKPEATIQSGQYNGVDEITVELYVPSGHGTVYYTTGGEITPEELTLYTGPITLTDTTVLRAVTVEEGACRSPVSTFSYFINENHTMPVVSLVGTSWGEFYSFNNSENKFIECGGNVAMYENGTELFNKPCGIKLKGFTAVLDPMKKNYGVYFYDRYGSTDLTGLDLFGDGITEYSSLLLRAGKDWSLNGACIRNEVMEELCHQTSPDMPCQSNRYCVLYINGRYYGIYCLKQNMNEHFYASTRGVSAESVEEIHRDIEYDTPLYNTLEFCKNNDMSDPELYAQFCGMFDIDNLIDYLVLQSYGGNIDLHNNVKFYRSPEEDNGKWKMVFYDQDETFYRTEGAIKIIFSFYAKPFQYLTDISLSLCRNEEFKDRLLSRFAEALGSTMSDENVLRVIDDLCRQLGPEIERDRARYSVSLYEWQQYVSQLKKFFEEKYSLAVINNLCEDLSLSAAEREQYFGAFK